MLAIGGEKRNIGLNGKKTTYSKMITVAKMMRFENLPFLKVFSLTMILRF
jgi:hypothetical protein